MLLKRNKEKIFNDTLIVTEDILRVLRSRLLLETKSRRQAKAKKS